MKAFKNELIDAVVNELKDRTDVLASWEIGSVANGTADQFSDTDLLALVEGSTDEIFQVVEAILESHSGIAHRWIEPQPPRPGQWQRVYILNDAPKHYFFDFGVVSRASKETLLELLRSERHGAPVVHFDKIGAIKPTPMDSAELAEKQRVRLKEISQTYPFVFTEVMKELDRGKAIDSYVFYFGLLKRLVDVLGIIYRPDRFDFGLRYLHRDLPDQLQREVERLVYVEPGGDLRARANELDAMYQSNLVEAKRLVGLDEETKL